MNKLCRWQILHVTFGALMSRKGSRLSTCISHVCVSAGCYKITTVFSHAQTVVLCVGCSTVLCQPTGGKARLTEGTDSKPSMPVCRNINAYLLMTRGQVHRIVLILQWCKGHILWLSLRLGINISAFVLPFHCICHGKGVNWGIQWFL